VVVLAVVGVLVQVGFVVWRMRTNPITPAAGWAFLVYPKSGERGVMVKEYFGATDCVTPLLVVLSYEVQAADPRRVFWTTLSGQLVDPDPPGWYRAWTDHEVRDFAGRIQQGGGSGESPTVITMARLGVGFPFRSFSGDRLYNGMLDRGVNSMLTPSGAAYSPGFVRLGSWEVPWRPIWSGLSLNVGMVVAAGLLVLGGLDWWRWHRRVREGQCPGCRYDLAGVPDGAPCPECGREPRWHGSPNRVDFSRSD